MAKVNARVLVSFFDSGLTIQPNNLVTGEKDIIETMEKAGIVDSNAKAVAYCKGQKAIEIVGDGIAVVIKETKAEKKAAADKAAADKAEKIAAVEAEIVTLKEALETAPDADKAKAQTDLDAAKTALQDLQK